MRRTVYIVGALLLLIVVAVFVKLPSDNAEPRSLLERIGATFNVGGPSFPACSGGPYFTVLPIDQQYLQSIVPLGNLNPSGHTFPTDHIYLSFTENAHDIPVYAPGNVTITSISSSYNAWADPPFTDYSISFNVCDGIEGYYIHVNEIAPGLLAAFEEAKGDDCTTYETGERTYEQCWAGDLNLPVAAGEVIATTAREDQHNFDLGVYDATKAPWTFANPERFATSRDQYPYTQCPFDYYTQELQQRVSTLFADFDGTPRTLEPVCGTVGQEVPGTAQGLWFVQGTPVNETRSEDPHMALVHDNFNPSRAVFSIGRSLEDVGIPVGTYDFTPLQEGFVNRDFSDVTPDGHVYCFEADDESTGNFSTRPILLHLPDVRTLHIAPHNEPTCGDGPWMLDQYVNFER